MVRVRAFSLVAILVPLLAACVGTSPQAPEQAPKPCPECICPQCPAPPRPFEARYEQAPFAAIPGWTEAELAPALQTFVAGCPALPQASPLRRVCEEARALAPADEAAARRFVEATFGAWSVASAEGVGEGLITGYYEPVLRGGRSRSDRFRQPVYGVPQDLVVVDLEKMHPELRGLRLRGRLEGRRLQPYWSRAEIETRETFDAPVLAWVEDAVELFFLQIQGSGQIDLGEGARLRLGYADQNGHPYRSLGRFLIDRGEMTLEQASMQGIKAWAAANPAKLRQALDANPSYVFFRELPASGAGPIGALGVPLTATRSVAVDPRAVPLGAPLFLATTWPLSTRPLQRLMVAQDTGGAIRGAVRADYFWGSGDAAGAQAGRMRQQGRIWILWPRGEALPAAR
jgi:membrane-bound lytic murein transglycosylase A